MLCASIYSLSDISVVYLCVFINSQIYPEFIYVHACTHKYIRSVFMCIYTVSNIFLVYLYTLKDIFSVVMCI